MPYANGPAAPMRRSEWDKRIQRAADLAERFPHAAEVLGFYGEVLGFQRGIYLDLSSRAVESAAQKVTFRERLDSSDALRYLPAVLSLAEVKGTAKLAEDATVIRAASGEQQREMLQKFLADGPTAQPFFARALLQPYAEWLAQSYVPPAVGAAHSTCPICSARPQAGVLRPEGGGGKRFLLCSLCLTEWEFRRVLCPVCGETDYQKLPRYSPETPEHVRVEACDACHFYLKSIDMTRDGLAVPLVDEVATVPLDLWASEHGYKKLELNLMGF